LGEGGFAEAWEEAGGVLWGACVPDVAEGGDGVEGEGGDYRSTGCGANCGDRAEERVSDRRGGAVGTASLRGMPGLLVLRSAGFRIWPFDAPSVKAPLVVEIYTRLMTGAVTKSSEVARTAYLAKKRRENALYAGISRRVMAKARASEDAFDALVTAMVMVEHRGEFARLRRTEDEVFRMEGQTWVPGLAPLD
jgi:hypothetical protein